MDAPAVTLASLRAGQRLRGVLHGQPVTLVGVTPLDDALVEIFFRDDSGRTGERTISIGLLPERFLELGERIRRSASALEDGRQHLARRDNRFRSAGPARHPAALRRPLKNRRKVPLLRGPFRIVLTRAP